MPKYLVKKKLCPNIIFKKKNYAPISCLKKVMPQYLVKKSYAPISFLKKIMTKYLVKKSYSQISLNKYFHDNMMDELASAFSCQ